MVTRNDYNKFSDEFIDKFFNNEFLDNIIMWIGNNIEIIDVYDEKEIIEFIKRYTKDPNEVFDEEILESWAIENGFKKDESNE